VSSANTRAGHVSRVPIKGNGVVGVNIYKVRTPMEAGGPKRNNTNIHNRTRFRRIVFTLNNWTAQEYNHLCSLDFTWLIIGKEVGEEGTPHLQGAAVLGTQMDFGPLKKKLGPRVSFRSMSGSIQQNIVYCSKEDPAPFIKGTPPKEGKRNDLKMCYDALREGATMRQLAEEHGVEVIKYSKGLMVTRSLLVEPRSEPPKVIWLYGSTGVGKTRTAIDIANREFGGDYWMSSGALQWFDGYDGQAVAILDDFRGKHCSFPFLLRLLDRYPLRVPFKGGFVEWVPRVIILTCPYSPADVFKVRGEHLPEDLAQLERRLTKVCEFRSGSIEFLYEGLRKLVCPIPTVSLSPPPVIDLTEEVEVEETSDLEILGDGPEEESDEGISLEEYLFKSSK